MPFTNPYTRIDVTADQLWSFTPATAGFQGAYDLIPQANQGKVYQALSLDPRTEIRHFLCWFDNDTEPRNAVALSVGQVIKRPFKSVRVETLYPSVRCVLTLSGAIWTVQGGGKLLCPQVSRFRVWDQAPCFDTFKAPAGLTLVRKLVGAGVDGSGTTNVMYIHAPGTGTYNVRPVFLVGNRNTANPNQLTANLAICSAEFDADANETPRTAPVALSNAAAMATAATPATADGNALVEGPATTPSASGFAVLPANDYLLQLVAGSGFPGTYTLFFAVRLWYGSDL